MSKTRAKALLSQNSVLSDFLSAPEESSPLKRPKPKLVKSKRQKQPVSSKPKPKPKQEPAAKKNKLTPVVEEKKRVTYYVYPKQVTTLLKLILDLNSEKGVATDKSQLVRAAIDNLANQNLDTIVRQLKTSYS